MSWSNIPDMDSSNTASDDNPFSGPKAPVPGKVSVQMSTEDRLCRKLSKLNITLVEGYPSHSSESGGLMKDLFLRPAKSQSKWYGLYSDHKVDPSVVSTWNTDSSKLSSCYSKIASLVSLLPHLHGATFLRKHCEDGMSRQERPLLSAIKLPASIGAFLRFNKACKRSESKGKGSTKASTATDELQYLMHFNSSITQAAAKMMEHLTKFVFISMGNLTLARRDAYLNHLKSGIKPDTVAALRTAPLHVSTMLLRELRKRLHNMRARDRPDPKMARVDTTPFKCTDKRSDRNSDNRSDQPAWKNIGKGHYKKSKGRSSRYSA